MSRKNEDFVFLQAICVISDPIYRFFTILRNVLFLLRKLHFLTDNKKEITENKNTEPFCKLM